MKIPAKLLGLFIMLCVANLNATNYFVKWGGSATADGKSWINAVTLSRAILLATNNNGDVIYLAAGNYDVTSSIQWNNIALNKGGVTVIGGFAGTEDEATITPSLSNPIANVTRFYGVTESTKPVFSCGTTSSTQTITVKNINFEDMYSTTANNISSLVFAFGSNNAPYIVDGCNFRRLNLSSTVNNNAVVMSYAGVAANLTIQNCMFYKLSSTYTTGGVFRFNINKTPTTTVEFKNCTIKNISITGINSVGAFVSTYHTVATNPGDKGYYKVTDCLIDSCASPGAGAFLNSGQKQSWTFSGCIIKNCISGSYGGAFHIGGATVPSGDSLSIVNSCFVSNTSASTKQAVSYGTSTGCAVTISRSVITNNSNGIGSTTLRDLVNPANSGTTIVNFSVTESLLNGGYVTTADNTYRGAAAYNDYLVPLLLQTITGATSLSTAIAAGQQLIDNSKYGLLSTGPSNFRLASVNYASLELKWDSLRFADSYLLKRSNTPGGPYTTIQTGINTCSFIDTGLTNGTTYYYVVAGLNQGGEGPNSDETYGTPIAYTVSVPTGLQAVACNKYIHLGWIPAAHAGGYNIKRSTTDGTGYALIASGIKNTAYNDTLVNSGTDYYYVVSAVNQGGESANSIQTRVTAGTVYSNLPELGWGPSIQTGLNLYVSTQGSDSNPGTFELPFRSVYKAQMYIRNLKSSSGIPEKGITVWIRKGNYYVPPLEFTSADSGTVTRPVIYRAYTNETVSLSTAKHVNSYDWKKLNSEALKRVHPRVNPDNLLELDLSTYGMNNALPFADSFALTWSLFDLIVDQKRQPVSQWPNPLENISGVNDAGWTTCNGSKDAVTFYYGIGGKPTDATMNNEVDMDGTNRAKRWKNSIIAGHDLWAKGFWRVVFAETIVKIADINTTEQWIRLMVNKYGGMGSKFTALAGDSTYRIGDGRERWCVINYLDEIDKPGEWAYDFKDKKLYYYPYKDIHSSEILLCDNASPVIKCTGTSNLKFIGLNISGSLGNGIELTGSSNILIGGCDIRNVASNGIRDDQGKNNTIQSNNISETGYTGIFVTNAGDWLKLIPSGTKIINNHIHHVGKLSYCHGVKIETSDSITLSNNLIHDIPQGGLQTSSTINSVYEYNEVHNAALKTYDQGGFYFYGGWNTYGNEVRYNLIHHSPCSNGFYTDNLTSGYNYSNNIVQGTIYPILTNGGHHVIVKNCLFLDASKYANLNDLGVGTDTALFRTYYYPTFLKVYPLAEPWKSFGTRLIRKYGYPASDSLWSCVLDPNWNPKYPNGSQVVNNVEVNSKGFYTPTHGTVTVANNASIQNISDAGFYDYGFMDLRTDNPTILAKFPNLNTIYPLIGLRTDEYRIRVVNRYETGGLVNRNTLTDDPYANDPDQNHK